MSFDPNYLFLDFIIGGIGTVLVIYGKKQRRWPQMAAGVAFMLYPYFVSTATMMLIVGVVIAFALWWMVRLGY